MVGETVSHYKILSQLGGGGMGVVYKAEDTRLKRTVALKFLAPELPRDPEAKKRFIHEAQAASSLDHPNICSIHDIGETDDGRLYLVMTFYEGETLKKKIERGPLSISEAVDIALQVAQGLAKAHEHGIVHRDLKPANIMVTADGVAKIVDFGVAKLAGSTLQTRQGITLGTIAYMSPEQARNEEVDGRTDLWSLGVVLYEMLTGRRPFESAYEQALVYSILNLEPRPVRYQRAEAPAFLEKICQRAMAKNPDGRYQNAAGLIGDLRSCATGSRLAGDPGPAPAGKRRRSAIVSAAAALVLAAAVILYTTGRQPAFDRIAVLPFHNLSKDSTQEYLADGMTEEVIARLQHVASLNVPSLRTTMLFKDSKASYAEIARDIHARVLVDASILWVKNHIRVMARLIDPETDRSLWSDTYDGSMEDILDLQSRIAQELVSVIRAVATPEELDRLGRSRIVVPEVYTATLKGKTALEHATSEVEIRQAAALFRRAVHLDSTYAPAWAGLGSALWTLAATGFEFVAPNEVRDDAIAAAENALSLDETLPDAHLARATIAWDGEWDVAKAQRHFERALALQPGYAAAHILYGQMLSGFPLTRFDEARVHFDRARDLDPLSPWNDISIIAWLQAQGNLEKALEEGNRIRLRDSSNYVVPWQMGFVKLQLMRPGDAAPEFEAALKLSFPARPVSFLTPLGLAYGLAGRRREALTILDEMDSQSRRGYVSPYYLAVVNSGLGRMDEAFRLLEKALDQRTPFLVNCTRLDPLSVALRRDARWRSFIDRLRKLVRLPAGAPDPYL